MYRFTLTVLGGCTLLPLLLAGTAAAGQIYRSVDAKGNVTFSSQPPAGATSVEEVTVRSGPSAEAQREARERVQRQQTTASEIGEARADRTRQQAADSPAAATKEIREVPVDQYYGYPAPREAVRDRVRERPVQLPARPVRLPARPVPR